MESTDSLVFIEDYTLSHAPSLWFCHSTLPINESLLPSNVVRGRVSVGFPGEVLFSELLHSTNFIVHCEG